VNNNVSDIKPWFRMDIGHLLKAIYFAMKISSRNVSPEQWRGSLDALASVALAVGVKPESFIAEGDIQLMRMDGRR